ncbi:MAG: inositol monophosphatase, partial [Alphaproteobacteria bacterium]|nr:inositol monophosphatase [Alphaproteobacteria bacterium]
MALRSALINVMWGAAGKAARVLARDFGEIQQLQVSARGPDRFAAAAVRRAAGILRQELVRARPGFGYQDPDGLLGGDADDRWLVEPLDGQTNFRHAIPHFAIVACALRRGEALAGIAYDLLRDELFWADRGQGAYMNEHRLRVSTRREPVLFGLPAGAPEAAAMLAQLAGAEPR